MKKNSVRKRKLQTGWYPENSDVIRAFIQKIDNFEKKTTSNKIAAIVPHAGWDYSGHLAVKCISKLDSHPETIVIIGGHRPSHSPLLYSPEEVYNTPLGPFKADKQFLSLLKPRFEMEKDYSSDNTVEIQLPILKYYYPDSKLVWLRIGAGFEAISLGEAIYNISIKLNRKVIVIGSTDLTHYGSRFSFSPKGSGVHAVNWVKNKNDNDIINKMINLNCNDVLETANTDKSACSAGGAVAAMKFARMSGINFGEFIGYTNSFDISPSESFVGYTGIIF